MARSRKPAAKAKAKSSKAGKLPGLHLTTSSPRRQRRAAIRTSSAGSTLVQRRSHFERVVHQHILQRRAQGEKEAWKFDPCVLGDEDVSLVPADVEDLLTDEATAPHALYAVLLKLRKVPNESDSSDEEDQPEEEGTADEPKAVPDAAADVPELPDLNGLAHIAAHENFISHESDEIRLFTACVLAEILRISAPNPPLSHKKLQALCTLFIDELSIVAFAQDHLSAVRFELLVQLASVKTFALFTDEEHVLADIFACFYAATRPHQNEKYREHLGYILCTLVEEAPEIEQRLLDALLAPLTRHGDSQCETAEGALRNFSAYSASATAMAEHVLVKSKDLLQVPICNFFNSALHQLSKGRAHQRKSSPSRRKSRKAADAENDQEVDSELIEDVEQLLVTVNRIAPEMLIYVIPSLEDRLAAPEETVRRNICRLLGKLFMSSSASIDAYPSLFQEYLSRCKDREESVRAEVCATLGPLLVSNPRHRELIDNKMQERVMDPDEKVRRVLAVSLGRTGRFASPKLIEAASVRMCDKKASVREEAFRQLSGLYHAELKLVPQELGGANPEEQPKVSGEQEEGSSEMVDVPDSTEDADEGKVEPIAPTVKGVGVAPWLSRLPNLFLSTHQKLSKTDDESFLSLQIERMLLEKLYSWDSSMDSDDERRVRRFAAVLGSLQSVCLVYMSRLLHMRARLAAVLKKICSIRLQSKSKETEALRKSLTPSKSTASPNDSVVGKKKTFSKRGRGASTGSPPENGVAELETRSNRDLRAASNALVFLLGSRRFRNEDVSDLCWKMCNFADRKFFEQLSAAVSLTSSLDKMLAAGPEAVARLSSKSVLGDFVATVLLPSAQSHLFSVQHIKAAFTIATQYCADMMTENDESRGSTESAANAVVSENGALHGVLRYLELSSLHMPQVYAKVVSLPAELILKAAHDSVGVAQILLCGLKVLARVDCSVIENDEQERLIGQLRTIITQPVRQDAQLSAVLAKWAARALVKVCSGLDSSHEVWDETRSILSARLSSCDDNAMDLVGPVTALGQIAKHAAPAFKKCYLESFDYAHAVLSGTYNSKLCKSLSDRCILSQGSSTLSEFWQSSFPPSYSGCRMADAEPISDLYLSSLAELARRSVKLMLYALHAVDADNQDVDRAISVLAQGTMKISGPQEKYGDIFELQSHLKLDDENESDDPNDVQSSELITRTCNVIRLASSCGITFLGRSHRHYRRVKPDDVLCAMMCVQDIEPEVRIAFARNIQRYVSKKGLPFRWIAALAMMAHDPDRANQAEVRSLMGRALREKRIRIANSSHSKSTSIRKLLPEACVPVLIWVLANHPDAEKDAENQYVDSEVSLEFLLDRLLETNEYAAVVHEYLDALMVAWDKSEKGFEVGPKTERIRALARISTVILKKKQAGKKWTLLEHPGKVELPVDLYRQDFGGQDENSVAPPTSLLDVARMYDADAQALTPKGGETPKALQTPRSSVKTPTIVRDLGETPKRSSSKSRRGKRKDKEEMEAFSLNATPEVTPKPSRSRRSAATKRMSPQSHSSKSSAQRKRQHEETSEDTSKGPSKGSSTDSSASKKRKKETSESESEANGAAANGNGKKERPSSGETKVGSDTPKSDHSSGSHLAEGADEVKATDAAEAKGAKAAKAKGKKAKGTKAAGARGTRATKAKETIAGPGIRKSARLRRA